MWNGYCQRIVRTAAALVQEQKHNIQQLENHSSQSSQSGLFIMENVFSYLSVCYHRLPYRLLILGLVAVDLLCTVYVICELPPFTGGYNFLTDDHYPVLMVIRSCTELDKKVIAKIMTMKYNFQVFRYNVVTETHKIQVQLQFDAIHCMGIYDK
ncbi:unnamed protein product [Nezara viridula]|uniref:Uncharacterized protein n=1 Tax=Nezara viridula TaxID=85310 RepID=A0A9P0MTK4_NEZVI|nr:unnamed protein product [Nezara viridula]